MQNHAGREVRKLRLPETQLVTAKMSKDATCIRV